MANNYLFNIKKEKQEISYAVPIEENIEPMPDFVRSNATGDKVFFVRDRKAHWVKSPEALIALGGDFGKVETVDFKRIKALDMNVEPISEDNAGQYKLEKKEVIESQVYEEKEDEGTPVGEGRPHEIVKGLTSIVIPVYFLHYNAFHLTGNCIGSIREHTDKKDTPYEIILVVNGDDSAVVKMDEQMMKKTYADKIIVNKENYGFTKAVNQGIRVASGEFIAVVSNDVQVYDDWLEYMQAALQELDLVMATPMYGMPFARAVEAKKIYLDNVEKIHHLTEAFSDFRDFSCAVLKRDLLNEIGLFDERFFMYCQDTDFLKRMDEAGKKYASTKLVNTHHIIQASGTGLADINEIMNRDKEEYAKKWSK